MIASVATPMRASIGCDEGCFSSPEECALAPSGLSALRSAEGLSPHRGGGGMAFLEKYPPPLRSLSGPPSRRALLSPRSARLGI